MTKCKKMLENRIQLYYNSIHLGGVTVSEPVLRITPKTYSGETTVISMRLAKELVKDIDMVANMTGYNRNEILTKSLEFALKYMEIEARE